MADLLNTADIAKAILDDTAAFEAKVQAQMEAANKTLADMAAKSEALNQQLMASLGSATPGGSASPALGF